MIGDTVYRFEDVDSNLDDGEQVLVKITYVDINTVTIAQNEDGIITITPRDIQAPAAEETVDHDEPLAHTLLAPRTEHQPKYRLEPEGNLFRLRATRSFRQIKTGTRGGLVASEHVLSHEGDCWIAEHCEVTSPEARVTGDARLTGESKINGAGWISGQATLSYVTSDGPLNVNGSVQLHDVHIAAHDHDLNIEGSSYIIDSTIEPHDDIRISGCNVQHAYIRNNFELVSIFSRQWGWLSAYRGERGALSYAVGCQRRSDLDGLLSLAEDHDVDLVQQEMLRAFVALAEAARPGWHGYVAPEPPKPTSFKDLAGQARDAAAQILRPALQREEAI